MQHGPHLQPPQNLWLDWLPVGLVLTAALAYCVGYILLRKKKKKKWKLWQVLSFLTGTGLLVLALLPSMMHWGHMDMRGHMVQHLLIAMYAPIFLVLGAPVTLALKVLSPSTARALMSFLKSRFFRFISHPGFAFILNIGGIFLLYLTPLFNASLENITLHYFIHAHFLVAGYLFTWAIIGPDPVGNRPGFITRLSVLFFSMAAHAYLSKLMYAHLLPVNSGYSDHQIREGAKMMYYWGDLSELILLIILFTYWYINRSRSRQNLSVLSK